MYAALYPKHFGISGSTSITSPQSSMRSASELWALRSAALLTRNLKLACRNLLRSYGSDLWTPLPLPLSLLELGPLPPPCKTPTSPWPRNHQGDVMAMLEFQCSTHISGRAGRDLTDKPSNTPSNMRSSNT